VASWGSFPCARDGHPGVWTDVSKVVPWVRAVMNGKGKDFQKKHSKDDHSGKNKHHLPDRVFRGPREWAGRLSSPAPAGHTRDGRLLFRADPSYHLVTPSLGICIWHICNQSLKRGIAEYFGKDDSIDWLNNHDRT
jgi:hypothetical protein